MSAPSFATVDELTVDLDASSVYAEGWQSWSPVGTHPVAATGLRPQEPWQAVMRWRPGAELPTGGQQGEGLLVVDVHDGDVRLYGAADPTHTVPSVRAQLEGTTLRVTADGPVVVRNAADVPDALTRFAAEVAGAVGVRPPRTSPTAWCSWYPYATSVRQEDVLRELASLRRHDLAVDVVLVDDGWQTEVGDWRPRADRFPSLAELVRRIRGEGRRAGLWLAPFVATTGSRLVRDHPGWLVGDAGVNWGQPLVGLDLTHPEVRAWLTAALHELLDAGVDAVKLDFLYAGCLPGPRSSGATPVEAYRSGLQLLRDVVGPEVNLVGCGAPLLPSVGLVDAMRVSPDLFHPDGPAQEPSGEHADVRAEAGVRARAWQHGRWWANDPDCLVLRPSFGARERWAGVVERSGGTRTLSDRVDELDEWGLDTARRLLAPAPTSDAVGR